MDALPLALMAYRSSAHRDLKLTPHEALTGRPMPSPVYKAAKGPALDVLTNDLKSYVKQLANIHCSISNRVTALQVKAEREEVPPSVIPGDWVYVKVFRQKWDVPRREGPYEVVRATATLVQVKGSPTWYHLNHCVKAPKDIPKEEQNGDVQRKDSLQGGEDGHSPPLPSPGSWDDDDTAEFPVILFPKGGE